ncbi:hypothetical protein [Streptomyces achromogenes]|uniref:hypothetical protein n=1 Tax=Streptomyces achromogenes TaxID=67255 RepID=UPI0036A7D0D8
MPHTRTILTSLATAVAAGMLAATGTAPAVAVTPAPSGTASAEPYVGCASLTSNANGRAQVRNICNYTINATVSVDWAWDPACKSIGASKSATFTWDSTEGRAEYAYEC